MDAGIEVPRGEIVNTETVSLRKKSTHTKKRGDGNKGPSKKSEVEAATSWKKNAQKQTAGYVGSHNIWVTKKTIQHKYN